MQGTCITSGLPRFIFGATVVKLLKVFRTPTPAHFLALATVLLLMVVLSLQKVPMADVPVHLATGRLIVEDGLFPSTNTFSWTYPDYPLYQQYPLFQVGLYLTWKVAGFWGLSLLTCLLWSSVIIVWMRWGGTWRQVAVLTPVWLLAVLGVQRHLLLRPEVLSLLFLGLLLIALDRLRFQDRWRWVAAAIAVQWLWAVSHQLFAIGLAVQVAFLVHLAISRRFPDRLGFDSGDGNLLSLKPGAALIGSVIVSTFTPLGARSVLIPFQTIGTMLTQGALTGSAQSAELEPVWTDPVASFVVVVGAAVVVAAAIRGRGRWLWFEFAMLALAIGLVLAALRGIGFFSLIAMGVASRWFTRSPDRIAGRPRIEVGAVSAVVFSVLLGVFWLSLTPSFLAAQPGFGQATGAWPDATVTYLKTNPSDGPILNIGWGAANVLIWEEFEVFVDPRWEAYPREFLQESIDATEDGEVLAEQLRKWQPARIVAELRLTKVQERAAELVEGGEWGIVHSDVLHVVLERGAPANTGFDVVGWDKGYPRLLAQEQVRVACWYERLGRNDDALSLRAEAEASGVEISADLRRFSDCGG